MQFHEDIIRLAKENSYFRRVLATSEHSQIVIMSIPPGGEIGEEIHNVDQTLFFVQGSGQAILNGSASQILENHLVMVPAGTKHNFINNSNEDLKLFTVYAPPEHKQGVIHKTRADSDNAPPEEH